MTIGSWQQRLAVFLISLVIIFIEITLMRELALRFWEHLAWLVISIALLGIGVSGTVLVLLDSSSRENKPTLQLISLLAMAPSIPVSLWLGDRLDINLIQMVWQPSILLKLGLLEIALGMPFLFGGLFIGLALQDTPEKVPGHYAASFLGSGAGGMIVLPALFLFEPRLLFYSCGIVILAAALIYVRGKAKTACWIVSALLLAAILSQVPRTSKISDDKDLPHILAMPGSTIITRKYSPQGLIEILAAPALHSAPGLALNNVEPVPPQHYISVDAQIVGSIYKTSSPQDYAFLDHTTQALPYRLGRFNHALIINDSGIDQLGLAVFHEVGKITSLNSNGILKTLKISEISSSSPHINRAAQIYFMTATVRGFLSRSTDQYPLIIFPTIGTDPGGLRAAAADSLLTRETLRLCFAHLEKDGLITASTYIHSPPRDSLRLLNMLVEILREGGEKPEHHIAIIRNWATLTIVASKQPLTEKQIASIRSFCQQREFDLVWLPDLNHSEANRYHQLRKADYYLGARLLLGPQNSQFVKNYIYDISIPDDGKPFFHHFSRWHGISELRLQLGKRGRVYLELGLILIVAALCQSFLLAALFIVLPLVPAIGLPGKKKEQMVILVFFSAIGYGFMLLEMGFLQRLTVYLAHPVYAAATVLSGFLFFGGLGSSFSSRLNDPLAMMHRNIGVAIVLLGSMIVLLSTTILDSTEGLELGGRIMVALFLTAPLAALMGMMFPLGLKRLGRSQHQLVPWAWSANGFSSVLATVSAPLLAMQWGFDVVLWSALGCYLIAAFFSLKLPS